MNVNKYKIPLRDIGISGTSLNIPINLNFTPIDNSELVQTKFIDDEVNKTINPIIDYKKVRFFPADDNWNLIRKLKINLNFYKEIVTTIPTLPTQYEYANQPTQNGAGYYGDIGFIFDDVFCRSNKLMNSFVRFNFYDSNSPSDNNLLFFNDIYTQIGPYHKNEYNFVLPEYESPITYLLGDSVLEPSLIHEGFYLYWYQDLVDEAIDQELVVYMAVTYNNAANGESTGLYPHKTQDYENVDLTLLNGPKGLNFLKIILKNDNGVYKYRFDPNSLQEGIDITTTSLNDIPTITFWQIAPNVKE